MSASAIFLSYAREDTAAARRIAEALRTAGLEVWFDENELRGGDEWDAHIRQQIRACALFLPIISAQTQARAEGYFRREWKLADHRTEDMGRRRAFLVPVCIDATKESDADVPDSFMRVQWTRLPGALPTPQFVAQVRKLLDIPAASVEAAAPAAREARPKFAPRWTIGAIVAITVGITTAVMVSQKSARTAAAAAEAKSAPPAAASAPKPARVADKSIAVLPFTNMSEDKDNAFFTDGIHEDILTNLALIRELRVVSRTSVMPYRTTTKSIRDIAQELGVTYILEGSVRRSGNKVRVTGQLIHAASDEHVWAQAYDRDVTDVFTIQAELSQQIAAALKAAMSPEEKALINRRPTENLEAYDAYTKAHQMALTGTAEFLEFRTIENLFRKAVALDPKFAAAWGELGRQIAYTYFNDLDRAPERLVEAKTAVETAVRLEPDSPEVIEAYGDFFYYGYRDYSRAAEQYGRLAVLRPNDANVCGSLGMIHRRQGRLKEGLAELQRAVAIEPRNLRYLRTLQQLMIGLNRYDEATTLQQRVVELSPGDIFELSTLLQIPFSAHGSTKECDEMLAQAKPRNAAEASFVNFGRKLWAAQVGNWAEVIRTDGVERYFDNPSFPKWSQDLPTAFALLALGDKVAARARANEALPLVQAELERKPSVTAWNALGGFYIILGRDEEALRANRHAMELVPESGDAVSGPGISLTYASTLAWTGDKDGALAELKRLLRTPFGENIYNARVSAAWLPLHGDPRFEALVNDEKNNAPLF